MAVYVVLDFKGRVDACSIEDAEREVYSKFGNSAALFGNIQLLGLAGRFPQFVGQVIAADFVCAGGLIELVAEETLDQFIHVLRL